MRETLFKSCFRKIHLREVRIKGERKLKERETGGRERLERDRSWSLL